MVCWEPCPLDWRKMRGSLGRSRSRRELAEESLSRGVHAGDEACFRHCHGDVLHLEKGKRLKEGDGPCWGSVVGSESG